MLAVGRLTAHGPSSSPLAFHSRQPCFTRKREVNVATLLRWNNMYDEREEITKEKEESDILLSAEETSREKYANTFPESRARNEISIILEFEQRIVSIRFSSA